MFLVLDPPHITSLGGLHAQHSLLGCPRCCSGNPVRCGLCPASHRGVAASILTSKDKASLQSVILGPNPGEPQGDRAAQSSGGRAPGSLGASAFPSKAAGRSTVPLSLESRSIKPKRIILSIKV